MLRDARIPGVAGNYDSTVATHYKHCGCRYEDPRQEALSHESYAWTLEHTSDDAKRFLGSLPFRIDIRPLGGHVSGPTIRLVHGNHALNTVYVTEDRSDEFLSSMANNIGSRAGDVICFGHTHKPWHRIVEGIHFVNTGSVGRPKDGDPRVGYVVLDVSEANVAVEVVRIEYDVEEAARGILASTLPPDLAEYLRTHPGKTSYASFGLASTQHIYGEAFRRAAKADSTHVPYKGDAPAMTDVVAGRVQYMFNNPVSAMTFAKQGRVRLLAVTGEHRLPGLADVPTMAEAGYPGFEVVGWFSFFVHAKTPRAFAEKLNAELSAIIRTPEMSEFLRERGTLPTGIGLDEFARKVAVERRAWARLIKDNDIRLE